MVKDPELKYVPNTGTAVATLTLAVDRRKKEDGADFIQVTVWGKSAENTANYMAKGRLMGVSGRMQTRTYDAKDGTKRYVTEVVADEVQFLDRGKNEATNTGNSEHEEMTPVDDGDIPF